MEGLPDQTSKRCSKCGTEKPLTAFAKNRSKKDGVGSHCLTCCAAATELRRKSCPEKMKAIDKAYRQKNREKRYAKHIEWRERNRDKTRAHVRESYRRHRTERLAQSNAYNAEHRPPKEIARERKQKWMAGNAEKHRAIQASRRAKKMMASPSWVDRAEIRKVYDLAKKLQAMTGIPHDVDHIVPLKHPHVCGLHVPWNLQILTKSENSRKGNRLAA